MVVVCPSIGCFSAFLRQLNMLMHCLVCCVQDWIMYQEIEDSGDNCK